jgi:succinate dehydrogenase / fumarate reductase iron-sulfur subunit
MSAEPLKERTVFVFRGDAESGGEVAYQVPVQPGMVVLDAIHHIQEHDAPDLAVRWNCKAAHCGSCSAEINGKPGLLCKTRIDQYEGQEIHVGPMKTFPLIKDLVTDVSWNYERLEAVSPRLTSADPAPFTRYQWEVDRVQEFHRCIECFLCQDVCHVLREHQGFDRYWGPRLMVKLAELEMHPEDTADRLPLLHGEAGVEYCNITHCCSDICPEGIEITHNAIIPLKERVADRYYDPIRGWLDRRRTRQTTSRSPLPMEGASR